MAKNVFIATTEPYSGKSLVAMGIINMLMGKAKKVAYFKPVLEERNGSEKDHDIQTILEYFKIDLSYDEAYGMLPQFAGRLLEAESRADLMEAIIRKVKHLEENYDFNIIEGTDFLGDGNAFEFETNAMMALNLNAPVVFVISAEDKTTLQVRDIVQSSITSFEAKDIQILAVIVNKVNPELSEELNLIIGNIVSKDTLIATIPIDKGLKSPTMQEILEHLGGEVIYGAEQLKNQVDHFVTGAMQLPGFLNYITENVLIITPGDRGDIILGAIQANISTTFPKIAGIVLTVGNRPDEPVMRLLHGLPETIPIIVVKEGTFHTTAVISSINSQLRADNPGKIILALNTFEKYIDVDALQEKFISFESDHMTPYMFQYHLTRKAKSDIKRIVLAEGHDDRILRAAARLSQQELVELTLLGDLNEMKSIARFQSIDLDFDKITVIDPKDPVLYEDFSATLHDLRRHKDVTLEMARDLMNDVSYFATMMVYKGMADGMVSGATHTTQQTIRPALQFIKTQKNFTTVSSIFFMCLPDRVSVYGDCAVIPNPNAEQMAEIAIASADSAALFGIEPRIAMLSYSSGSSGMGADVEKVRAATAIVKARRPDLKIEGPLQYDAAVDPYVAMKKMPDSEVAGKASVIIFPDLNTGNNTYKAVQRETGALAIGPMLQGLNKPINDLSRGATVDDVFNTVIITAIQAQEINKK